MHYRSWLLVAADSEKKLAKAALAGADVVVVDLVETSEYASRASVRQQAAEWLNAHRLQIVADHRLGRWVRINALDSSLWRDDLVAVMAGRPDGIVLPRSAGPAAVQQVAAELYELEQRYQIPNGATRIAPMAGGTPLSALAVAEYGHAPQPRLAALAWSAAELAEALGATRTREAGGGLTAAFQHVRAQVLLAAHACSIMAIDAVDTDQTDDKAVRAAAGEARADGFSGMFAHHPAQVEQINQAFTPNDDELAQAQAIVTAFNAGDGGAALYADRNTVDPAQLRHARRLLGLDDADTARGAPILRPA